HVGSDATYLSHTVRATSTRTHRGLPSHFDDSLKQLPHVGSDRGISPELLPSVRRTVGDLTTGHGDSQRLTV
ncbi:MAG: hypothetical protein WD005_05495, partial [Haliea sp.]